MDVDYSAIIWYYALCMEFLLDAAMVLETYETCYNFYRKVVASRSNTCALRDPECVLRLTNCLAIWQLRMNVIVTATFVQDVVELKTHVTPYNFQTICNCFKALECYLLILKHQIHIRRSSDLFDRLENAKTIIKFLRNQSLTAPFVKPFLYLLQSYMELLCARKLRSQSILVKACKFASSQENKLVQARIEQNKRAEYAKDTSFELNEKKESASGKRTKSGREKMIEQENGRNDNAVRR